MTKFASGNQKSQLASDWTSSSFNLSLIIILLPDVFILWLFILLLLLCVLSLLCLVISSPWMRGVGLKGESIRERENMNKGVFVYQWSVWAALQTGVSVSRLSYISSSVKLLYDKCILSLDVNKHIQHWDRRTSCFYTKKPRNLMKNICRIYEKTQIMRNLSETEFSKV